MRILFFLTAVLFVISAQAQPDFVSWDTFLKKYVTTEGEVDYKGIKANKTELDAITKSFSAVSTQTAWNKNDQLAFWINVYNAFTIDLIVNNYPVKSIRDLDSGKPWDVKRITIGNKKYSLNNIENDIIRPQFKDPRIHFAVNCAAKSCPPLQNRAFFGKSLNSQLEAATKNFINNTNFITVAPSKLTLSRIFDWYAKDFGNITDFLNKFSTIKVNKNPVVSYYDYNWSLNEKK